MELACPLDFIEVLVKSGALETGTPLLHPTLVARTCGVDVEEVLGIYDRLVQQSALEVLDDAYHVCVQSKPLSIDDELVLAMLRDVYRLAVERFSFSGEQLHRLAVRAIVDAVEPRCCIAAQRAQLSAVPS